MLDNPYFVHYATNYNGLDVVRMEIKKSSDIQKHEKSLQRR